MDPRTPLYQAWCRWLDLVDKNYDCRWNTTGHFSFGLIWPDLTWPDLTWPWIWYDTPGLWNDAFFLGLPLHWYVGPLSNRGWNVFLVLWPMCIPAAYLALDIWTISPLIVDPNWIHIGYILDTWIVTWIDTWPNGTSTSLEPPNDCYVVLWAPGLFSLRVRRTCSSALARSAPHVVLIPGLLWTFMDLGLTFIDCILNPG